MSKKKEEKEELVAISMKDLGQMQDDILTLIDIVVTFVGLYKCMKSGAKIGPSQMDGVVESASRETAEILNHWSEYSCEDMR